MLKLINSTNIYSNPMGVSSKCENKSHDNFINEYIFSEKTVIRYYT